MLKLIDLLQLCPVALRNYKIHCATGENPTPLEAFFAGDFEEWQRWQTRRNFECDHIVSLIHLGESKWLFAGVYKVLGVKRRKWRGMDHFYYSTREVSGLDHLTGRVIVEFEKNFRASYLRGPKYIDRLVVSEIRPRRLSIGDFPGYNSVLLSHASLRLVIREEIPSWKSALSSVSAIYVIADRATGKLYVGSAYGEGGLWQRWAHYAATGHGGNRALRELLASKGRAYAENFQYSILEVCDLNVNQDFIAERETYWKNVLCSREFGYNEN